MNRSGIRLAPDPAQAADLVDRGGGRRARAARRRRRAGAVAAQSDRVAFERGNEIWVAPVDGSKPPARLFFARGAGMRTAELLAAEGALELR